MFLSGLLIGFVAGGVTGVVGSVLFVGWAIASIHNKALPELDDGS